MIINITHLSEAIMYIKKAEKLLEKSYFSSQITELKSIRQQIQETKEVLEDL